MHLNKRGFCKSKTVYSAGAKSSAASGNTSSASEKSRISDRCMYFIISLMPFWMLNSVENLRLVANTSPPLDSLKKCLPEAVRFLVNANTSILSFMAAIISSQSDFCLQLMLVNMVLPFLEVNSNLNSPL